MKRCGIWLLTAVLLLTGCTAKLPERADNGKMQIVATVFPAYDFARAAAGEFADVTLLLPPGTESHSYEPTPADILTVRQCDLFLYLGGESDSWVDTILEAVEPMGVQMRMIDCVELLEEETVEGMMEEAGHHHDHDEEEHDENEHHHETEEHHLGEVVGMDEHVWTAPCNAAAITLAFAETMAELDPTHAEAYRSNAEAYAAQIEELDEEFAAFFNALEDRTIIFGDRFPLRYFADEFGLNYYAAFPGCSTQTEPSAATVAFLTNKVKEENISTVWYIEFSNHLVADAIAEAAGAETAQFHTCHNVSPQDLRAGATYVSLMQGNLEMLKNKLT